jgi:hypothetical protein
MASGELRVPNVQALVKLNERGPAVWLPNVPIFQFLGD